MNAPTKTAATPASFALGSIAVAIAGILLKAFAWQLTGSVALFSDALESLVNLAAACGAYIALRQAARPPDVSHPFGHHKAEYFSAVVEGVLIIIAALLIMKEAWDVLFDPRPLQDLGVGLFVNSLAAILNGAWAWHILRRGRAFRSPALVADAKHLFADVATSIGVIIGVIAAGMTGWYILDPLLAAAVAVNVLWSGWHLVRDSVGGLMDEAAPEEIRQEIHEQIQLHGAGSIQAHDLRTRVAGQRTFLEFHLVVPRDMRVADAHRICDAIEDGLRGKLGDIHIAIHVEPAEKAKPEAEVIIAESPPPPANPASAG
ncbi:cation diffusion facilitator family transporter [Afifella sp. IM 167]|uniref:cation diffusion facilitator family transporter n=1 Tax=Afifella sp. IM 167 TaxID=2033586 RepID=UPI001CCBCE10|nr:cation diffusion facilitator family transporter [Afifella sp. IM 167]MBZ8133438.1 cation-efflux pump [Afifella sp. IM 167]